MYSYSEDWQRLGELRDLARTHSCSFSINYCEADNSWYSEVRSSAPAENFTSRNRDFNTAVEYALMWIRGAYEGSPF